MNTMKLRTLLAAAMLAAAPVPAMAQPGAVMPQQTVVTGDQATRQADQLPVVAGGPAVGKREPKLEVVALFPSIQMPTGVTVSNSGRIFVCYPRWGDPVMYTVAEVKDGQLAPFPDAATNDFRPGKSDPRNTLISVQSVVVDAKDRLWLLDPGSLNTGPVIDGGPKLWGYDLASGQRVKAITFPRDVALKKTYLNDIRFDLARGAEGTAYITDSGAGGIIVVDLASGSSWRKLDAHPSTKVTPGLKQMADGQPFIQRKPSGEQAGPQFQADGIAISPDASTLYYTPLVSRDVYAVPTNLLADRTADPQSVANAVRKVATKPSGNDGIICDAQGRIYTTDFEDSTIRRIDPATGQVSVLLQDERLTWPDTLAMHKNYLYIMNNQLSRQPSFQFGKDQRKTPYVLMRVALDGEAKGEKASR